MNIILIYFAIKYHGDWDAIYNALERKEKVELDDIVQLEQKIKKTHWSIVTILDLEYPAQLKTAYKPPFVLWVKGDKRLLAKVFTCLTGNQVTTQTSEYIKEFAGALEKTKTFVTGAFPGVDEMLNKLCQSPKLFVLAHGLDEPNFKFVVNENDLLMTEYPYGTHASKETYKARNRLVAALAEELILVSSQKNGGINHLVTQFLQLGKDINCLPGEGGSDDGNSELVKQGANLITSAADILK